MPSEVSVTIRLGRQPFPDAESVSPGLMLGRSSSSSPGFGAVLDVVGVPGGAVVVGGVVVVDGGVVGVVVGAGGVVVVPGRVGRVVTGGGGVVVTGGGGVVVTTPVTTKVPLAVCRWLVQVAVTA
ncbi:hypothetical protein Q5425_08480 [Amycolatopsis sp. A133]|uniref:hypothetical protein n=1 Tax=Amycolatopsis sp. A133 TaxID=3064472 RepID=UPI0027E73DC2|nr:hypothetical protein [Amycolatopsis sp. A133]MDQ7803766.1 hypothetical protein [Amycolatopsis sp. A133]